MPAFFLNAAAQLGGSVQQRVYLDESGTLGYSGELFTMAMVLVRDLPKLEACTLKNRVTQSEIKASQMKTAQKLALARTLLEQNDIDVYLVKLDPLAAMMCERKLDKEFLYDSMVAQALAFYLERGDMPPGLPYRVSMDIRGGLRESYEDMVGESVANVLMHREVPLVTSLDVRFLDSKYSAGVQAADLFSNIYRTALTQTDSPCLSFLHKFEEAGRVHAGFTFGLPQLADQMDQIASDLRARVELEAQLAAQHEPQQAEASADKPGEPQTANASEPAGETRSRRSRRSRGGRGRGGTAAQEGVEAQQGVAARAAAETSEQTEGSGDAQANAESAVAEQAVTGKDLGQATNDDATEQAAANGMAAQAGTAPTRIAHAATDAAQVEDAPNEPARTARRRTHKKAGQVLLDAVEGAAEQGTAGVESAKIAGEMTDSSTEADESAAALPFAPAGMGVSRSARRRRARAARREKEAAEALAAEAAPQGEQAAEAALREEPAAHVAADKGEAEQAQDDGGMEAESTRARADKADGDAGEAPAQVQSGAVAESPAQVQSGAAAEAEPVRARTEEAGSAKAEGTPVKGARKKAAATGGKKAAKAVERVAEAVAPNEAADSSDDATEASAEAGAQAEAKPARSRRASTRKRANKKAEPAVEAVQGEERDEASAEAAPANKDADPAEPQTAAKPDVKPGRAARSRAAESRKRRSKAVEAAAEAAAQPEVAGEPSAQAEPAAQSQPGVAEAPVVEDAPKPKAKRTRTRKPAAKKAAADEPALDDAE